MEKDWSFGKQHIPSFFLEFASGLHVLSPGGVYSEKESLKRILCLILRRQLRRTTTKYYS